MAYHSASATVNAPAAQAFELFSHFDEYPKFLSFVKEVTYSDSDHSHWVTDILGRQEWDAANSNWIPETQLGWTSTDGLQNTGIVTFEPIGPNKTRITIDVTYEPPAGVLGAVSEHLGGGQHFESRLQHDLENLAVTIARDSSADYVRSLPATADPDSEYRSATVDHAHSPGDDEMLHYEREFEDTPTRK